MENRMKKLKSVADKGILVRRVRKEHPAKCYDLMTDGISRRIEQLGL